MEEQKAVVVKVDRSGAQNVFDMRFAAGIIDGAGSNTGPSHSLGILMKQLPCSIMKISEAFKSLLMY